MKYEMKLLIKKAQRHDKVAFTQLMQEQSTYLYRTAINILKNDEDAADAIQETILTCWEKLFTLKKTEYFKTWMTRILMNHCNDIIRERGQYTTMEEYEEPLGYDEYNIELKELYDSLDEKYRLPIELFYGQGYKVKEIAEILEIPQNTIKTYLSRGRQQIARFYGVE